MKLSDRAKLAFYALTNKNMGNSVSPSFGQVLQNYGPSERFAPQKQLRGITYKAIDKIGMSVSIYKPQIIRANGDAYENHPLLNLAMQPNSRTNGVDFLHMWAMMYEIYGETFWYLARGETSRKVKEVYLLNPEQIELVFDDEGVVGYILHRSDGTKIPLEVDEVLHDKRPNPFNEWRGMSVMERASIYIDTEITTSTFTLNYMRNNASPSGIVSLPDMQPEVFKQFAQQWRENYEGPQNAGKTAFIRGGSAEFKAVGATLKDVDQKVTREMAKDDVLMMLEVPKPLLGLTDGEGFGRGNLEALHYIYSKEKIEPMMRRLDAIYHKLALIGGYADGVARVSHESPIPRDKEYLLQRNDKALNRWVTINEARESEGLPAIDNEQYDTIEIQEGQTVTPKEETKSLATRKVVLKRQPTQEELDVKKKDEQESHRKKLVETSDKYAGKVLKSLATHIRKQQKTVIENINVSSKTYEEWLFNIKDESELMAKTIAPIIIALMEEQIADTTNFITGKLVTIPPEIRDSVEVDILRIVGIFNTDTIHSLENTLAEGQTNGESLAKLKKRVETVFADAKGYRAERIARTESLRAANNSAELAYKESGFNSVRWRTNPDACPFCESFNGQVRAIGANYKNIGDVVTLATGEQMRIDYDNLAVPPLHPNCECSLDPED